MRYGAVRTPHLLLPSPLSCLPARQVLGTFDMIVRDIAVHELDYEPDHTREEAEGLCKLVVSARAGRPPACRPAFMPAKRGGAQACVPSQPTSTAQLSCLYPWRLRAALPAACFWWRGRPGRSCHGQGGAGEAAIHPRWSLSSRKPEGPGRRTHSLAVSQARPRAVPLPGALSGCKRCAHTAGLPACAWG